MFSYVFMKLLESRPKRYDAGIALLSGGHAKKLRKQIVRDFVLHRGMKVLDIGCGTGLFMEEAAKAGAIVTGIDISAAMLKVAQNRLKKSGLQDRVSIHNRSAAELDTLFNENSFDLVVSTLVFSELYTEERLFVLHQISKLLKPNGQLVIAGEVRPKQFLKRFIHFLIRFPLAVFTYIVAQTGTKPLKNITEEVAQSGFSIVEEKRTILDSFVLLSARAKPPQEYKTANLGQPKNPDDDKSVVQSVWDTLGRWFPNPVEPGLRVIGNPDRNSPVVLTSNFHLTVRRMEKALKKENLFLLVAQSNGINVWCASEGGEFNTHSAITAIKTSRINERVNHNRIILPQFSASGINPALLKKETGRTAFFGPAYARNLPEYLRDPKTVFKNNKADFSLPFRMEMLLAMNFIIWLAIAVVTFFVAPKSVLAVSACFWLTGLVFYAGYPLIPGKSGWLKAFLFSTAEIIALSVYSYLILNLPPFAWWKSMLGLTLINFMLGFDLKGIVAGYPSEAEWLMKKLGMHSFGHIFSAKKQGEGLIAQDTNQCTDCGMCFRVCPKRVFGFAGEKNIRIVNRTECFACNACVTQCPENALMLQQNG